MKKTKLDFLLINILWLTFTISFSSFIFNTIFGFNFFSKKHWLYLQELQMKQISISQNFYLALIFVFIVYIVGTFFINKIPKRNIKINIETKKIPNIIVTNNIQDSIQKAEINNQLPDTLERPRIPLQSLNFSIPPSINISNNNKNLDKKYSQNNKLNTTLKDVFANLNFILKPLPRFKDIKISLCAIDKYNTLWIGSADEKIENLEKVDNLVKSYFDEYISDYSEDLIRLKTFIISDEQKTNTLLQFKNNDDLKDYLNSYLDKHKNDIYDDETFELFNTLIDSLITFINSNGNSI